jgi:AAA domain-containing protein
MSDPRWTEDENTAFLVAMGNPSRVECRANGNGPSDADRADPIPLVSLEAFAAVDEPGAQALVGGEDAVLIPEGGDVLLYGDGGAGKTTLSVDLGFHLAAGKDWLGIPIVRRARVLLVENEGPRPLFRRKLLRKLAAWRGPTLDGHISVLGQPWGEFSFADDTWRSDLAAAIAENEIDVLIAGPVTRLGMNEAGTLQHVRDFMTLVAELRAASQRLLTVVLIHHENKGGSVSGAWEGSGDTLLHVQARGNGETVVRVQKSRWSSVHHGTTLNLAWTAGEGFATKGERDLGGEIEELLSDGEWRTAKEIAAPKDAAAAGVGANIDAVKEWLIGHPDEFCSRTGDAAKQLARSPNATVWSLTRASESDESESNLQRGEIRSDSLTPPYRESVESEPPPTTGGSLTRPAESAADSRISAHAHAAEKARGEASPAMRSPETAIVAPLPRHDLGRVPLAPPAEEAGAADPLARRLFEEIA